MPAGDQKRDFMATKVLTIIAVVAIIVIITGMFRKGGGG